MGRRKKKNLLINLIIIIIVGIVFFALFWFYGASSINKPKVLSPAIINDEVVITDAPIIKEETDNWSISANYPTTGQNYIDSKVKLLINGQIADFKKDLLEVGAPLSTETKNALTISYAAQIYNNRILSFKFATYWYTGGAHPNENSNSLVFDMQNKEQLMLSDLFIKNSQYLEKISIYVVANLKQRDIADETSIDQGAGPAEDNYKVFGVSDKAIIFYFPPYAVAPYAAGEQIVEIPFAQIKSILNPEIFITSPASSNNQTSKAISLESIKSGDGISSPLNIIGSILSSDWETLEGQVGGVDLLDSDGNPLASASLSATTNWNILPVGFKTTLTFVAPQGNKQGQLVFYNKNVSGKAENDKRFILPIIFK